MDYEQPTFTEGQKVWYVRNTWVGRVRYIAEVVKSTPKRVSIRLHRNDGTIITRYVVPESLEPRVD